MSYEVIYIAYRLLLYVSTQIKYLGLLLYDGAFFNGGVGETFFVVSDVAQHAIFAEA